MGDRLLIAIPTTDYVPADFVKSLAKLQQELGRKILVCVGDGENDVTMMEDADYAFCPGDAIIRDRFENVCGCAEGAVADVIYKKIPEILGLS